MEPLTTAQILQSNMLALESTTWKAAKELILKGYEENDKEEVDRGSLLIRKLMMLIAKDNSKIKDQLSLEEKSSLKNSIQKVVQILDPSGITGNAHPWLKSIQLQCQKKLLASLE